MNEPNALPRNELARKWRESLGLSRTALSARTGFSASTIQDFEEGKRRGRTANTEISEAEWLRYGLACAAFNASLKLLF